MAYMGDISCTVVQNSHWVWFLRFHKYNLKHNKSTRSLLFKTIFANGHLSTSGKHATEIITVIFLKLIN